MTCLRRIFVLLTALFLTSCAQEMNEQDRAYMVENRQISVQAHDMAAQARQDSAYAVQEAQMARDSADRAAMISAATEEKMNRVAAESARK